MIEDFANLLKNLLSEIISIVGSSTADWDKKSYESVVKCLMMEDDIAVREAVDQLVKEGKSIAIPPLYLTSQRHPNQLVRKHAWKEISQLESHTKINELIKGKDIETALETLIKEYGHFKDDYA